MKAIGFLILNEIVEYLIKILTDCLCEISVEQYFIKTNRFYYPTALNGCWGIVFTHGVRMVGHPGGWAGNSLSGLYLRNRKV